MSKETENLTLEILRRIQGDIADLRTEIREGFTQANIQLAAMGQQIAGLTTAVYASNDRYASLERRVERIERRLELKD